MPDTFPYQPPSISQGPSPQETIQVPIPGSTINATVDFPAGTPPEEIAQALQQYRETHPEDIQDEMPTTMQNLPDILSTIGGVGGAFIAPPPLNIATAGGGAGGGKAIGRLGQELYKTLRPPKADVPYQGQSYELPLQRTPIDLPQVMKEIGTSSLGTGALAAGAEGLLPKLGPAMAGLGRMTGVRPFQWAKEKLASKYLYPEATSPETQQMLQIDKWIREQAVKKGESGDVGLPISRLGGDQPRLAAKTMEAISSGGISPKLQTTMEAGEQHMQQFADQWAGKHGFPSSYVAGQTIKDMIDASENQYIGRVQDAAYGKVRRTIPANTRFINGEEAIHALTNPDNASMRRLVTEDLRNRAAKDPTMAGSLLRRIEGDPAQLGGLTFDEAVLLRTELYKIGRRFHGEDDPATAALGQGALNEGARLSEAIKRDVGRAVPALRGVLEQADKSVSKVKDIYTDPKFLKFYRQLDTDKQAAVKELRKPENVDMVKRIRKAVDPSWHLKGQPAGVTGEWKEIQDWMGAEMIRDSTLGLGTTTQRIDGKSLKGMLEKYDPDTITTFFDPRTWKELHLIAKGLGEFEKEASGIGKIAIQLQTPGAVMGVAGAGGAALGYGLGGDEPGMGAAKGAALGVGIVMTPRMLGNLLVNPSLLKHFRDGVWEYRQLGTPGPTLRAVLRQLSAQGASQAIPNVPQRVPGDKHIQILPPTPSQPTPTLPLP